MPVPSTLKSRAASSPLPLLAVLLAAVAAPTCATSAEDEVAGDSTAFEPGNADAEGSESGNGSNAGSGPDISEGSSGGTDSPEESDECAGQDYEAKLVPLDMFIMLDRSGSMQGSKWADVKEALETFVSTPVEGHVGVGLGFFPADYPVDCYADADCGGYGPCEGAFLIIPGRCVATPDECALTTYSNPSVPIQPLPGAKAPIETAIGNASPSGGTPMAVAMQGAIAYATQNQAVHPDHLTTVVLVSDGYPEGCGSTSIQDVSAQAASGLTQDVRTFVIGIGDELDNLNEIAAAGDTESALIIGGGTNVADEFQQKLEDIRGSVQCLFQIPKPAEGGTPDFDKLNVEFTPADQAARTYFRVASEADCSGKDDEYYYDDPVSPTTIILCQATCDGIKDNAGRLAVTLGCKSEIR